MIPITIDKTKAYIINPTNEKKEIHRLQEKVDLYKSKTVTVLKTKNNLSTVIEYDGNRYTLQHPDQFKRGGKGGKARKT